MLPTLNQVTCQRIAEVVTLTTEKYWHLQKHKGYKNRSFILNTNPKSMDFPNPSVMEYDNVFACPTTLPEFIELFKKLGEVKGWKKAGDRIYLGTNYNKIDIWHWHFLSFVDLAATDWNEAEKYLNSLLT